VEATPKGMRVPSVEPLTTPELALSPGWKWLWDRLLRPISEDRHEDQEAQDRVGAANTHPVCTGKES
jgi:hypothetical protein